MRLNLHPKFLALIFLAFSFCSTNNSTSDDLQKVPLLFKAQGYDSSTVPFLKKASNDDSQLQSHCSADDSLNFSPPSTPPYIPPSSEGLMYKYDKVTVGPRTVEEESKKIYGFIEQSCYPHESDGENEPVCIFLNPDFNHGRGAVALTRSSVLKAHLKEGTAFKRGTAQVDPESRGRVPFVVADMPHKGGKGAIANRKLHPGDLVITDHATILISTDSTFSSRPDWLKLTKIMVDLLPLKTRAYFATLHGVGETEEEWISSAIERNAFEAEIGPNLSPHFAIVPEPSRLNHDCRPNTSFWFDEGTMRVYMYAIRDIAPGEELTISYREMLMSREERQKKMSSYGFDCACSLCSLPDYLVEVSDRRIEEISSLSRHLKNWKENSPATPEMSERFITLYELERLDLGIHKAYTLAALAHNAVGDTAKAKVYADLALQKGMIETGRTWRDRDSVTKLLLNPTQHWSYNHRIKAKPLLTKTR